MAATVYNGLQTPSDYAGSTLDLAFNKPEVYKAIVQQHSNQFRNTFGLDLRMMGLELPMESDYGTEWLEGWVHENFEVLAGGVAASAPGGTQVIPLAATSIDSGRFYPKAGHVIVYPSATNEQGIVESVDLVAGTITVRAAAAQVLPLLAGGETMAIMSSAFGNGTDQPEASKKEYEQIHYWTQIVKDDVGIDGSQLTNAAWVEVSEWEGTEYKFYKVAMADLDARMDRFEEGALLMGNGATYTPTAGSVIGSSVRQTKGIIPWGIERGNSVQVVPAALDKTDLRDARAYFMSEGDMTREIFGWVGRDVAQALTDEFAADVFAAGGTDITDAVTLIMGNNGINPEAAGKRAVTMNYRQWNDTEGSFVWKTVDTFNDPKGLGSAGYTFYQKSMWLPMCNVKDARTGEVTPNVALRYKESDGYSRRRELVDIIGATNGAHNTSFDRNKTGMKSEIAMQVMNPNLIHLTRPEA